MKNILKLEEAAMFILCIYALSCVSRELVGLFIDIDCS